MIKFFQSFGGVFVLKVVSEFGFGNGKCHFSSVEQIFPFCGWCWIDMLGKLPLFSSFVKHWRNDVIPQKMTRPTPHWHPLLVFFVALPSLGCHSQNSFSPSAISSTSVCVSSKSAQKNGCYSLILVNFLHCSAAFWLQISSGVSFDSGRSDLKICNQCRNISL